jgi:hypothetical protein
MGRPLGGDGTPPALAAPLPQVPLELLVNVDDPQDAAVWLDVAYNRSQGLVVVPVFSQNIHEHRCLGRVQRRTAPCQHRAQQPCRRPPSL